MFDDFWRSFDSGMRFLAYLDRYGSMWTKFQLKPSILDPNSVFFKFPEVRWPTLWGEYVFEKHTQQTNRRMLLYFLAFLAMYQSKQINPNPGLINPPWH